MSIKNTLLTTAATTILRSELTNAVTAMYFCNTSSGPQTFSVYALPAGEVADISNVIYYNIQISPTDTFVLDTERLILDDGDSIVAIATQSNVIVATISYVGV